MDPFGEVDTPVTRRSKVCRQYSVASPSELGRLSCPYGDVPELGVLFWGGGVGQ